VDLSTLANLINAFAVAAGVIFAAVQIRYYRQQRRREAMLELVESFQSPTFTSALRRLFSLPDGADAKKIHEVLGPNGEDAVYMVSLTWESLGLLVFRREATLELVGDFFSGPILVSWRKLSRYVSEQRAILQRDTAFEWVEWLAKQMMEDEKQRPPVPAHIAHRDWKQL
jgi:hypothetical protein